MSIEMWLSVSRGYLLGTSTVIQQTCHNRSDDHEEKETKTAGLFWSERYATEGDLK